MSTLDDRLLELGGRHTNPPPMEESGDVRDVPLEPVLRPRMIERHGLPDVDDDDASLPVEQVVLAEVRVYELGLPNRLQVRDYVRIRRRRIVERDLSQRGGGLGLVPDVLHHEDVVQDPLRSRHPCAGVVHPDEVLVLLLGPGEDGRPYRLLHFLEAGVALDVNSDVPERRVGDAVDLDRLRSPRGVGGVEHARLLPRADGIVQRRYHAVTDERRNRQEGRAVEHLLVRLLRIRVLLLRPECVYLALEGPHPPVVNHRPQNERSARLRAFWTSEDVNRFGDETTAAHVAGLGLRVPVLDVALLILELPHLHDEQVPLADPHPLLELARDPAQPALAVLARDPDPGGAQELVCDPHDLALFRPRHADADDLFFRHFRNDGGLWLKRLRVSLRKTRRIRLEPCVLEPGLAHRNVRVRDWRRLKERRPNDVDAFR